MSTDEHHPGLQRAMLESEGVVFRGDGTIDLERFGWEPSDESLRRPREHPGRRRARSAGVLGWTSPVREAILRVAMRRSVTIARNIELQRRAESGERSEDLASEFGLSLASVDTIVRRVVRLRSPDSTTPESMQATAPPIDGATQDDARPETTSIEPGRPQRARKTIRERNIEVQRRVAAGERLEDVADAFGITVDHARYLVSRLSSSRRARSGPGDALPRTDLEMAIEHSIVTRLTSGPTLGEAARESGIDPGVVDRVGRRLRTLWEIDHKRRLLRGR